MRILNDSSLSAHVERDRHRPSVDALLDCVSSRGV